MLLCKLLQRYTCSIDTGNVVAGTVMRPLSNSPHDKRVPGSRLKVSNCDSSHRTGLIHSATNQSMRSCWPRRSGRIPSKRQWIIRRIDEQTWRFDPWHWNNQHVTRVSVYRWCKLLWGKKRVLLHGSLLYRKKIGYIFTVLVSDLALPYVVKEFVSAN